MKIPILGKRSLCFTEIKATGFCLNCEKDLPKRRKKYCSDKCRDEFYENHIWTLFRMRIIKKRGRKCEDCGFQEGTNSDYYSELHVHHLKRIIDNGELCNPENVVVVCSKCHGIRHRKVKDNQPSNQ